MEWHGQEDVEPLQDAKDKGLAQAQSSGLCIFYFSDPRSHWVYRKANTIKRGWGVTVTPQKFNHDLFIKILPGN